MLNEPLVAMGRIGTLPSRLLPLPPRGSPATPPPAKYMALLKAEAELYAAYSCIAELQGGCLSEPCCVKRPLNTAAAHR